MVRPFANTARKFSITETIWTSGLDRNMSETHSLRLMTVPIMTSKARLDTSPLSSSRLTLVDVRYRKNRINHRILFGLEADDVRRGWHRKAIAFLPGQVFGYERWTANRHGTQAWSVVICRAAFGRRLTKISGILPGAELWLHAVGKTQVTRVFAVLDAIRESNVKPENISKNRWRAIHNLIQGHKCPLSLVRSWSC